MKDLDELKRLLAAATPRPWPEPQMADRRYFQEQAEKDWRLAVAAVNAAPYLIAEIERLREVEEVDLLQSQLNAQHAYKRIERLGAALREIAREVGPGWDHHCVVARAALESEK